MDGQTMSGKLKTARILQWILAIMPILIGALHTDVHIRELATEPYALELSKIQGLKLMGLDADVWKLWQGFSLAMGLAMIMIGLLSIVVLRITKGQPLPLSFQLIILTTLGLAALSGAFFFGPFQLYGGVFGMVLQVVAIILNLGSRN